MEILAQVAWDYTLYRDGERRFLQVVCGTVALFELAVELTAAERDCLATEGPAGLRFLVQAIRDDPFGFQPRKVDL